MGMACGPRMGRSDKRSLRMGDRPDGAYDVLGFCARIWQVFVIAVWGARLLVSLFFAPYYEVCCQRLPFLRTDSLKFFIG